MSSEKKIARENPASFSPFLTEYELYLFGKGDYHRVYEKMGAHLRKVNGRVGVNFAVWAPNAKRVSVVGDFNGWDSSAHPMIPRGNLGVWEVFIPGVDKGALYKYHLLTLEDNVLLKADPYAFFCETPPGTASMVWEIDSYKWNDKEWMEKRKNQNPLEMPISIYEVHLGSWMRVPEEKNRVLTYTELAEKLIPYVKEMGFTHIELLPVMAHPYDASWGYQVTGYFSPTPRYGNPQQLMQFIDMCHQNEIGVILDWVPAHFPKDDFALARFDGTCLYEHLDPRQAEHKDWGTLIFNYGRCEVANFLLGSALFWLEKYHADGLRVDAVSSMLYLDFSKKEGEWVPNKFGGRENLEAIDFLKKLNILTHQYFPGVLMIAEESTAWSGVTKPTYLGGLGFGFKWNMGWMHDTLYYMSQDPVYRKYHHDKLTFSLLYAFQENFILPLSHDEVVHGKGSLIARMPQDVWQKFANLRLLFGFMFAHPGKKLIFMGQEIGQWREWDYKTSLDWHLLNHELHRKLQKFVKDLNALYQKEPSFYTVDFQPAGFEWIDFHDVEKSIISFIRKGKDSRDILVFVFNFTPLPRENYKVGVPFEGFYREILNSDSQIYGGSNIGNLGGVFAQKLPFHKRPFSLNLTLPPLGM
ncbi:1,4-alpha-glucan branching protein GlgB, partial [Candidatus Aerophobetes bacterium]|nr:1,4-alpha-glucan branching protein GlgB [Candidatus Aerophobetes bacterium]